MDNLTILREMGNLTILREMDAITILREALTATLLTLQNVHGYAVMDVRTVEEVEDAIERCESTLQLTDKF